MDSYIQKVEKVTKNQEINLNESLEIKNSNKEQQSFSNDSHLINVNSNNNLMEVAAMQQKRLEENVDSIVPPVVLNQNKNNEYRSQQLQNVHNTLETETQQLQESTFVQRNAKGEEVTDSDSMVEVKNALRALNVYWDSDATSALNENGEKAFKEFSKKYEDVISAAQHYIDTHKWCFTPKGRQRRSWVKDIKTQCEYEKGRLRQAMTDVYTEFSTNRVENKENQKLTYGDILRYIRSDIIVTKKRGLSGGNNSDVFVIEGYDDKVFKKFEYVTVNFDSLKARILNSLPKFEKYECGIQLITVNKACIDYIQKCIDESKDIVDSIDQHKYQIGHALIALYEDRTIKKFGDNIVRNIYDLSLTLGQLYRATKNKQANVKNKPRISGEEVEAKCKQYEKELIDIYAEYLPSIQRVLQDKEQEELWDSLINENSKCINTIHVAKTNEIHLETRLSARNIATCRIAKMLNMENLVIKCENVMVKDGDTNIEAIQMEKAKGKSLYNLYDECRKDRIDIMITPKVANDINRLMLLDLICGQADRHGDNIFVDYKLIGKTAYITAIKGIDNDMSFGDLGEDALKTGFNRMAWLYDNTNKATFKRIDKGTYDEIMALRDKYDLIEYTLADTDLNKDEFKALKKRIDFICDYLEEQKNNNNDFIIDSNELETGNLDDDNKKLLEKDNWYLMGEHKKNTCLASIFFEECKVKIANNPIAND